MMEYDRYSSHSVKLLTDWIIENMHDTLRDSTPTTPIDIPPSKLLNNIINTNSPENMEKIIREALKQALISTKGESEARLYVGLWDPTESEKTNRYYTFNPKSQTDYNEKATRKKIRKQIIGKVAGVGFGIALILVGVETLGYTLQMPVFMAGQYLTLTVVIMAIGGFVIYISNKKPIQITKP